MEVLARFICSDALQNKEKVKLIMKLLIMLQVGIGPLPPCATKVEFHQLLLLLSDLFFFFFGRLIDLYSKTAYKSYK